MNKTEKNESKKASAPETRKQQIIELLWDSLKLDPRNKSQRRTGWGTKSQIGLIACLEHIFEEAGRTMNQPQDTGAASKTVRPHWSEISKQAIERDRVELAADVEILESELERVKAQREALLAALRRLYTAELMRSIADVPDRAKWNEWVNARVGAQDAIAAAEKEVQP